MNIRKRIQLLFTDLSAKTSYKRLTKRLVTTAIAKEASKKLRMNSSPKRLLRLSKLQLFLLDLVLPRFLKTVKNLIA